jgi:hypothetical protein
VVVGIDDGSQAQRALLQKSLYRRGVTRIDANGVLTLN